MHFAVQFAAEFPQVRSSLMMTGLGRIAQGHLKRTKGGYAYLAEPAVRPSLDAGELFLVPKMPVFKRKAYAIYNHDGSKNNLIQELLETL
jgi:DNA-binding transcriptional LysR family regulator